ncbi:hypothetical protein [Ferrimonas balearica]|uniref:hypothetical protein n=1 Tax=Ferrimonas balearica TaxID=44012 RepID=UPI001F4840D6|nr:hypothetical protein [Ferrimonas balearica]MBY6017208.1 hypothetical protein [Halomonas denitrificans]MBY6093484.1 hypothetical protein [Ferrimonas balearica]
MSFTLVMLLLGALLLLVIGINLMQQHKEQVENVKRQEMAKQRAIIEETEQILSMAPVLPFTSALLVTLNQRILDALDAALVIDPKHTDLTRRKADIQAQLTNLAKGAEHAPSLDTFSVPNNEKQVLAMVQTLKRLKAVIRNEHSKSRMNHDRYVEENHRVDQLQVRINATVLFERARMALQANQMGSAKQLLSKLVATLNSHGGSDHQFKDTMLERANELLGEIDARQKANLHQVSSQPKSEKDDLDQLFQPKKKW